MKTKWIKVEDGLPKELETVWAYNVHTGFVALACLYYADGWLWAVSNGVIYSENENIVAECEQDDDYNFTHWCSLPKLPNISDLVCRTFVPDTISSSATKCKICGKEKWQHPYILNV